MSQLGSKINSYIFGANTFSIDNTDPFKLDKINKTLTVASVQTLRKYINTLVVSDELLTKMRDIKDMYGKMVVITVPAPAITKEHPNYKERQKFIKSMIEICNIMGYIEKSIIKNKDTTINLYKYRIHKTGSNEATGNIFEEFSTWIKNINILDATIGQYYLDSKRFIVYVLRAWYLYIHENMFI